MHIQGSANANSDYHFLSGSDGENMLLSIFNAIGKIISLIRFS